MFKPIQKNIQRKVNLFGFCNPCFFCYETRGFELPLEVDLCKGQHESRMSYLTAVLLYESTFISKCLRKILNIRRPLGSRKRGRPKQSWRSALSKTKKITSLEEQPKTDSFGDPRSTPYAPQRQRGWSNLLLYLGPVSIPHSSKTFPSQPSIDPQCSF